GDTTFGPGGTSQIYRFQGWLPASGQATLNLTSTSGSTTATSVTYSSGSPGSLTFTLSGSINSANALTVGVSYLTAASAYSFKPASTSTWSTPVNGSTKATFGGPTDL